MSDDDVEATIRRGRITDGGSIIHDHTEKSLADGLAGYADVNGWHVRREVVIPGWGRLDLLLSNDNIEETWAVELKVDLHQQAQVRKAFAQADGYYRYLSDNPRGLPEVDDVFLVALSHSPENLDPVDRLYGSVTFDTYSQFMGRLSRHADLDVVQSRLDAARREVAVREAIYVAHVEKREAAREAAALAALTALAEKEREAGPLDLLDPEEVGSE